MKHLSKAVCIAVLSFGFTSAEANGVLLGAYTVGQNPFGTDNVVIHAVDGESFADPAGCAGSTTPTVMLRDAGNPSYSLILSQVITAVALKQRVTFYLSADCLEAGWGLRFPEVVGVFVHGS